MSEHTAGEQGAENGPRPRCPGCGHSCCPYPGLECGGDSDVVLSCDEDGGVTPPAVPATPNAGDASEGLTEAERRAFNCWCWTPPDGIRQHERFCPVPQVERIVAARVSAAATKARAEGIESAAALAALYDTGEQASKALGVTAQLVRGEFDVPLAPDTAGGDR